MLAWNACGLGGRDKRRVLRNVIRKNNIDFICVLETKLEIVDEKIVNAVWGRECRSWYVVPSLGLSGGVLCIWNHSNFLCQLVLCRVQWCELGDRNTKSFHLSAAMRREKNVILSLSINGRTVSKPLEMKEEVAMLYKSLCSHEKKDQTIMLKSVVQEAVTTICCRS